jgi:hypothetical protein
MPVEVIQTPTTAPVAAGGTISFPYPANRGASSYLNGAEALRVPAIGMVLVPPAISVSYGATAIIVTYVTGATIPANVPVYLGVVLGSAILNDASAASQNYPDIQIFTRQNGKTTWTKPSWASASTQTRIIGIGGGGGGGSGRQPSRRLSTPPPTGRCPTRTSNCAAICTHATRRCARRIWS